MPQIFNNDYSQILSTKWTLVSLNDSKYIIRHKLSEEVLKNKILDKGDEKKFPTSHNGG